MPETWWHGSSQARSGLKLTTSGQPIDPGRSVVKQRGLLTGREAVGQALECVPQYGVGTCEFVHWEVALEHAPFGAEFLYAM